MTDGKHWVLGLTLDEDLTWAAARVSDDPAATQFEAYSTTPGDLIYGRLADLRSKERTEIDVLIDKSLGHLQEELPKIFSQVRALGVSTIGIADQASKALISVARKDWVSARGAGPIVQFDHVAEKFFPRIKGAVGVQNDATAKCLAEYHWQDHNDRAESIFFAMFSQGVNAGSVNKGLPVAAELHQELGHIWPPLHEHDQTHEFDPDGHSGCPIHTFCYEGLASGGRIQNQWKKELRQLRNEKARIDGGREYEIVDIIAHYMAHFCWTGALTVSPQRILLGGPVIFPEIVPLVIDIFSKINRGIKFTHRDQNESEHARPEYLIYPAMAKPGFIRAAKITRNGDALGALEVARLTLTGQLPGTAKRR